MRSDRRQRLALHGVGLTVLLVVSGLTGCATIGSQQASAPIATPAPPDLSDDARLDVSIVAFENGLPEDDAIPDGIYPEIRNAETTFVPELLRKTLEQTGQWGTVTVVPTQPTASDLTVSGEILASDGLALQLQVTAQDASGLTWFNRRFRTETTDESYMAADGERIDPYQPMFNTIANALVEARAELTAKELRNLREISQLQFASDLAPEVFGDYLLETPDGRTQLRRLPALDDPMMERVLQVRARDQQFMETLGIHYRNFSYGMDSQYLLWRDSARQQKLMKRELRNEQIKRGVVAALILAASAASIANLPAGYAAAAASVGGLVVAQQVKTIAMLGEQKQIHENALSELAQSFEAEVTPMVFELQGTTTRLAGTAVAQFEQWQQIMRDLYQSESFIPDLYLEPHTPTQEDFVIDGDLPAVNPVPSS